MARKAFTLIELLVVIAIIALLLAILVPILSIAKEHTRRVICSTHLKSIGLALVLYAEDNGGMLPLNDDERHPFTAYREDTSSPTGSNPMKLGLLHATGLIDVPQIFYCPSNRLDQFKYKSYTRPGEWGTLPQDFNDTYTGNQWVRTGYTYFPQSTKKTYIGGTWLPDVAEMLSQLDNNKSVTTDIIWKFVELSHVIGDRPRGLNALFGDGHVTFSNNPEAFDPDLWVGDTTSDNQVRPDTIEFRMILDLLEP